MSSSSVASFAKKIAPLLDRVLIRRFKIPQQTSTGIFIPEKSQERLNRGEVVAVGPGSKDHPAMQLRVGDKVLLPAYGGQSIKMEGMNEAADAADELVLFKESEVLAKLAE